MKESMQLFLLFALFFVCSLFAVMYPMSKLESFLLWAIIITCVGDYAYRRHDFLWH